MGQQLINKHLSICHESNCFSGISTQWPTQQVVHCIIPSCCNSAFFQSKWSSTKEKIRKLVNKNIKEKRSATCKCTSHSHKINDLVVIYTPLCYDRECASFDICVMWYINCYHLKEANKSDYNNESRIWGWPLYQVLRDNNDDNNNDEEIHDFTCTVIDDGSAETPLVIQIPHAYSSMMPLQSMTP